MEVINQPDILRSIIELAPQAIVTIDSDGTVLSFSPAGETLFGYRHDEIEGKPLAMLVPEAPRILKEPPADISARAGRARLMASARLLSGRRKDGAGFPVKVTIGEAVQGDSDLFIGFIEDLSREQAIRRELDQALLDVERFSRLTAMGEMAASIAHDLNQPLTGAMAAADTADLVLEKEGFAANHPARERIGQCLSDMQRAADLIRHIKSFLKTGEPQKRLTDLNAVVREGTVLALAGADPQIDLDMALDPSLPAITVDPVEIQQVVINLVRNAVDALRNSENKALVVRTDRSGDDEVIVSVADSGEGIEAALIDQLFDPMVTSKPDGLGLGLTISRRIARAHDGRIVVAERDGMTVFSLIVPQDSRQAAEKDA